MALISIALIGIFSITLLTCYIFPIYPDEIQVRFWLSRLPYDFPQKISGAPTCVAGFSQPIPVSMYLPGFVNWALHGNLQSLHALRQVGIIVAFLWVAGLAIYLRNRAWNGVVDERRALDSRRLNLYTTGMFIAIFSVGVFPIFLILNRTEQLFPLSLALLLSIFLASDGLQEQGRLWWKLALAVMYFVAVSLIVYGHLKGLLLTPFFMIVGWRLFQTFNSRPLFILAAVLLGLHVAQGYFAHKYAYQCGDAPKLDAFLKSFSLDPAALIHEPQYFFAQAYQSLMRFPEYLDQLGFKQHPDVRYLPSLPLDPLTDFANVFVRLDFAIAFLALLVLLPFRYYRNDIASGRFITFNAALLTLFACLLVSAVFNLPKNWYDAGYFYAVLAIILVFFIGENFRGIFRQTAARGAFYYLACVALLSQAVFIDRYLPAFWSGYAGPGIPLVGYVYEGEVRGNLEASSRTCDIDPVRSQGVIVDDYTYFYYQKSKRPMAFTYILLRNDAGSIQRFISGADSAGLAVRCSSLPPPYISFAKKTGNVCCISRKDLKNLPPPN